MNTSKTKKKKIYRFFTYGTLCRNFGNSRLFNNSESKWIKEFQTEPKYTCYAGGFPIVEREGNTSIKGEIWETTSEEVAKSVFRLEGCDFYNRENPNNWYSYDLIDTPEGEAVIFCMNKGRSGRTRVVTTGDWRKDG